MPSRIALRAALILLLSSFAAEAADKTPPVSQEKFNRMITVMKRIHQRLEHLEQSAIVTDKTVDKLEIEALRQRLSKLESGVKAGGKSAAAAPEGAVNLDDMDKQPSKSAAADKNAPIFKVYFDLNLYWMPGGTAQGSGFT